MTFHRLTQHAQMLVLVCLLAMLSARAHAQISADAGHGSKPSAGAATAPDSPSAPAPVYPHANTVASEAQSTRSASGVELEHPWDFNRPHFEARAHERGVWYGWQTLILDTLAIGILSLSIDASVPRNTAVGLLLFDAPIVHFAHGSSAAGFTSLTLRLLAGLAALLGGVQVALAEDDHKSARGGYGLVLGGAVVGLSAVVLDAAVFAFEPRRERASQLL
jgi:hypothetical protein